MAECRYQKKKMAALLDFVQGLFSSPEYTILIVGGNNYCSGSTTSVWNSHIYICFFTYICDSVAWLEQCVIGGALATLPCIQYQQIMFNVGPWMATKRPIWHMVARNWRLWIWDCSTVWRAVLWLPAQDVNGRSSAQYLHSWFTGGYRHLVQNTLNVVTASFPPHAIVWMLPSDPATVEIMFRADSGYGHHGAIFPRVHYPFAISLNSSW